MSKRKIKCNKHFRFFCSLSRETKKEFLNWYHVSKAKFQLFFGLQVLCVATVLTFVVMFSHTATLEIGVNATVPLNGMNSPENILKIKQEQEAQRLEAEKKPLAAY